MTDDDLQNRQEVERRYHNTKYRTGVASEPVADVGAAYAFFDRLIDQLEIGTVLDFGCGDGWLSVRLAKRGHGNRH